MQFDVRQAAHQRGKNARKSQKFLIPQHGWWASAIPQYLTKARSSMGRCARDAMKSIFCRHTIYKLTKFGPNSYVLTKRVECVTNRKRSEVTYVRHNWCVFYSSLIRHTANDGGGGNAIDYCVESNDETNQDCLIESSIVWCLRFVRQQQPYTQRCGWDSIVLSNKWEKPTATEASSDSHHCVNTNIWAPLWWGGIAKPILPSKENQMNRFGVYLCHPWMFYLMCDTLN